MEYLKIRCYSCGKAWNIYQREADWEDRPPRCPFCQRSMSSEQWERLINCLFTVAETNKRLRSDGETGGRPLFQAEIRQKYVDEKKRSLWEEADD